MKNMFFPVVLLLWCVCASSSPTEDKSANQGATFPVANSLAVSEQSNLPWAQRGSDIDGEAAGDAFGSEVSLNSDGSVVAIGAIFNDDNGDESGHVKVFAWDGTTWVQRGLDIVGEAAGDETGSAVSLSSDGGVVAIGAIFNDDNGLNSGHVRVFAWDGSAWVQRGLDIDGEMAGDIAGFAVSLSGDGSVVAVGACGSDFNGSFSGNVRVFTWDGTTWLQRGLNINGEAADDNSGRALALSSDGNVVAIGAYGNDDNGRFSGHVRVYAWNGTAWVQRGLDIDGEAAFDKFGYAVSLSSDGGIVAIGAEGNDGNGSNSGHVRVFSWNGTTWVQRGFDIDGEAANDYSGRAVALSSDGNVVAIGAYGNDGNGSNSGHVRVFSWNGTTWVQRGFDIDGEAADDYSGRAVALSSDGNVVAIGAYGNDGNGSNSGHVRVYVDLTTAVPSAVPTFAPTIVPCEWEQKGTTVVSEEPGENFGRAVSLSYDGKVLAVGAYLSDAGGSDSGRVSVYSWKASAWTQMGADIVGGSSYSWAGTSVDLSSDGNIVAVGEYGYSSKQGRTRIFAWSGSDWVQQGTDIIGEETEDRSGQALSVNSDGSSIVISSPTHNGTNGVNSGHVRVFVWTGSAWMQKGFNIYGDAADDIFGKFVSMSDDGNAIAVGADGSADRGYVKVYTWTGSAWLQKGSTLHGDAVADRFGYSVALSGDGNYLAIGAVRSDANGTDSGQVKVFTWSGSSWVQVGDAFTGDSSVDEMGFTVALNYDGTVLAMSAPSSGSGLVRCYKRYGWSWAQLGSDIIGSANTDDRLGRGLALSSDGLTAAVGASESSQGGYTSVYTFGVGVHSFGPDEFLPITDTLLLTSSSLLSLAQVMVSGAAGMDGSSIGATNVQYIEQYPNTPGLYILGAFDEPHLKMVALQLTVMSGNLYARLAQARYKTSTTTDIIWAWDHPNNANWPIATCSTCVGYGLVGLEVTASICNPEPNPLPTIVPTAFPTFSRTAVPTAVPTTVPTAVPTTVPTSVPTATPTTVPTTVPTSVPTATPTTVPTTVPTSVPTATPTTVPTTVPTSVPTATPTTVPTTVPTSVPSATPTTVPTTVPTAVPTAAPTTVPTTVPTAVPTAAPTSVPTTVPTAVPTMAPTIVPTFVPTEVPTTIPTVIPPVIIESDHKYSPYTNEEWVVEIPNTTCYAVTMDPQSWTPHSGDVVQIFGITTRSNEGDVQKRYPIVGGQLYKRRLRHFGTMDINAEKIKVVFKSDGSKQAWGFKLYLTECT